MKSSIGTVFMYELKRALSKKSFWLITASIPLFMALISAASILGGMTMGSQGQVTTVEEAKAGQGDFISWTYDDQSKIIDPAIAANFGGKPSTDIAADINKVKEGTLDATFEISPNLTTIKGHGIFKGVFKDSQYQRTISDVIYDSGTASISDQQKLIYNRDFSVSVATYQDGEETNLLGEALVPGIFVVLLYFTMALVSNYALNATLEEKENRVSEMIFTSVSPYQLLIGKFLSILMIVFIQSMFILVLSVAQVWVFQSVLPPLFDPEIIAANQAAAATPKDLPIPQSGDEAHMIANFLASIDINPMRIGIAFYTYLVGIFMVLSILAFVGSLAGSAKDAGQAVGLVLIGSFVPLIALSYVISADSDWFVTFLSWFPLTQPLTTLLRNAVSLATPMQAFASSTVTLLVAILFLWMTTKTFKSGSMEYQGMSLKQAFATITNR